jgi:hypothetical protein
MVLILRYKKEKNHKKYRIYALEMKRMLQTFKINKMGLIDLLMMERRVV